jgi:hypothetical protein
MLHTVYIVDTVYAAAIHIRIQSTLCSSCICIYVVMLHAQVHSITHASGNRTAVLCATATATAADTTTATSLCDCYYLCVVKL